MLVISNKLFMPQNQWYYPWNMVENSTDFNVFNIDIPRELKLFFFLFFMTFVFREVFWGIFCGGGQIASLNAWFQPRNHVFLFSLGEQHPPTQGAWILTPWIPIPVVPFITCVASVQQLCYSTSLSLSFLACQMGKVIVGLLED